MDSPLHGGIGNRVVTSQPGIHSRHVNRNRKLVLFFKVKDNDFFFKKSKYVFRFFFFYNKSSILDIIGKKNNKQVLFKVMAPCFVIFQEVAIH